MRTAAVGATVIGLLTAGGAVGTYAWAQQREHAGERNATAPAQAQGGAQMPDLVGALRSTPGCLGVEAGQFDSGKQAIFAWFEDKEGAMRWYNHDVHQGAMASFMKVESDSKPMAGVPDGIPVLAIASITFADRPHFEAISLPISQIAIELYTPIKGGIHLGGTFAPPALQPQGLRDLSKGE